MWLWLWLQLLLWLWLFLLLCYGCGCGCQWLLQLQLLLSLLLWLFSVAVVGVVLTNVTLIVVMIVIRVLNCPISTPRPTHLTKFYAVSNHIGLRFAFFLHHHWQNRTSPTEWKLYFQNISIPRNALQNYGNWIFQNIPILYSRGPICPEHFRNPILYIKLSLTRI